MNQHEDNQDEMKNIVRIVIGVFLFWGAVLILIGGLIWTLIT